MAELKPVQFWGNSLDDLREFPRSARREAGYQLDQIQRGADPDDWKPMASIGAGVREIRIRDRAGAFRIIYVVRWTDAIHVLHCFKKTSQKTSRRDVELARQRCMHLEQEKKP